AFRTGLAQPEDIVISYVATGSARDAERPATLSRAVRQGSDTQMARVGLAILVESRMGAVAWAIRQRSVSHPRSSNRTCPIKASGSPTGFTVRHTAGPLGAG